MSNTAPAQPTPVQNSGKKISIHPVATLFLIVLFLLIVWQGWRGSENSSSDTENQKGGNPTSTASTPAHKKTKTIHVKYGKEYGEEVELDYRYWVKFVGSTTAYCAMNQSGLEKCADKGHNLSLGDSDDNAYLKFKSRDGEDSGELEIQMTEK